MDRFACACLDRHNRGPFYAVSARADRVCDGKSRAGAYASRPFRRATGAVSHRKAPLSPLRGRIRSSRFGQGPRARPRAWCLYREGVVGRLLCLSAVVPVYRYA